MIALLGVALLLSPPDTCAPCTAHAIDRLIDTPAWESAREDLAECIVSNGCIEEIVQIREGRLVLAFMAREFREIALSSAQDGDWIHALRNVHYARRLRPLDGSLEQLERDWIHAAFGELQRREMAVLESRTHELRLEARTYRMDLERIGKRAEGERIQRLLWSQDRGLDPVEVDRFHRDARRDRVIDRV